MTFLFHFLLTVLTRFKAGSNAEMLVTPSGPTQELTLISLRGSLWQILSVESTMYFWRAAPSKFLSASTVFLNISSNQSLLGLTLN
ncbi:hypothetical protein TTHERM_000392687 (macronuclear) [Tetrahymena thermophila SB210]|uniref:Transmembrane protein n=1 Tax=Tetrahymena thermophila (strain SB210) TaxID=312017 RepID=W7XL14_TETTS|nr:hypothetical protein TTHERM_000392687 [Tetrahymena thermophila SB210]EWS75494.1 hypothetical protein TTHERM_000392687 [Tetrahymena thermophila SB210]|eukprot:XP_012651963.1 hypothetical protein TTHERM_000392687 [Tetrahymena thermophila SB210]